MTNLSGSEKWDIVESYKEARAVVVCLEHKLETISTPLLPLSSAVSLEKASTGHLFPGPNGGLKVGNHTVQPDLIAQISVIVRDLIEARGRETALKERLAKLGLQLP